MRWIVISLPADVGVDAAEGIAFGRRMGELDESFVALQLTSPFLRHRKHSEKTFFGGRKVDAENGCGQTHSHLEWQ